MNLNREFRFGKKDVTPYSFEDTRNVITCESALIRGDRRIDLHNQTELTEDQQQRLERFRHAGTHHWKPVKVKWMHVHADRGPPAPVASSLLDVEAVWPHYNVRWCAFDLKFVKIIGEGGFGLATLWEATFEDDETKLVVIKMGRPNRSSPAFSAMTEFEWHIKYEGATHTVQTVDLQLIAMRKRQEVLQRNGNRPALLRYEGGAFFVPLQFNIMVLEYAQHGDLDHVLGSLFFRSISLSPRQLWQIWECLVRGVISVAYQTFRSDLETYIEYAENQVQWEAHIDHIKEFRESHDVHFDANEYNTLVADDPKHTGHPALKMHDFGTFSYSMPSYWSGTSLQPYWLMRSVVKPHRVAPEQVHSDWDSIAIDEDHGHNMFKGADLTNGSRVAGRYGTWTNVFMIGRMMESVITGDCVFHPFTTAGWDPNDTSDVPPETYGWRMFDNTRTGRCEDELIDEVLKAQMELPANRPSPVDLLKKCIERRRRGFSDESDNDNDDFWKTILGLLPEPRPDYTGTQTSSSMPDTASFPRRAEPESPAYQYQEAPGPAGPSQAAPSPADPSRGAPAPAGPSQAAPVPGGDPSRGAPGPVGLSQAPAWPAWPSAARGPAGPRRATPYPTYPISAAGGPSGPRPAGSGPSVRAPPGAAGAATLPTQTSRQDGFMAQIRLSMGIASGQADESTAQGVLMADLNLARNIMNVEDAGAGPMNPVQYANAGTSTRDLVQYADAEAATAEPVVETAAGNTAQDAGAGASVRRTVQYADAATQYSPPRPTSVYQDPYAVPSNAAASVRRQMVPSRSASPGCMMFGWPDLVADARRVFKARVEKVTTKARNAVRRRRPSPQQQQQLESALRGDETAGLATATAPEVLPAAPQAGGQQGGQAGGPNTRDASAPAPRRGFSEVLEDALEGAFEDPFPPHTSHLWR